MSLLNFYFSDHSNEVVSRGSNHSVLGITNGHYSQGAIQYRHPGTNAVCSDNIRYIEPVQESNGWGGNAAGATTLDHIPNLDNFTMSCWADAKTLGFWTIPFLLKQNNQWRFSIDYETTSNNTLYVYISYYSPQGGYHWTYTSFALPDNNWHYLTVTKTRDDALRFYVNGELKVTKTTATGEYTLLNDAPVEMGFRSDQQDNFHNPGARLGNLRFDTSAATAEQIRAQMLEDLELLKNPHVLDVKQDSFTNNNAAVVSNYPAHPQIPLENTLNNFTPRIERIAGTDFHYLEAELNGNGNYVQIDRNLKFTETDSLDYLSVAAWVRVPTNLPAINGDNEEEIIVSFDRSEYFRLSVNAPFGTETGAILFATAAQVNDARDIHDQSPSAGHNINDGQWHFITAVYDGDNHTKKIYLDGLLIDTAEGVHSNHGSLGTGVDRVGFIGAGSEDDGSGAIHLGPTSSNYINIGRVIIRRDLLSPAQIKALMAQRPGSRPAERDFWLDYHLDHLSDERVLDSSGHQHDAVFSGFQRQSERIGGRNFPYLQNISGQNSYLDIVDNFTLSRDLNYESFAFSLWLKLPQTLSSDQILVSMDNSQFMQAWVDQASNTLRFNLVHNGGTIQLSGSTAINDNQWHFVTFNLDCPTRQLNIMLDGTVEAAEFFENIDRPGGIDANARVKVGSQSNLLMGENALYFDGDIGPVRFERYALELSEHNAWRKKDRPVTQGNGLVFKLTRFEKSTSQVNTLLDESGNDNHARFVEMDINTDDDLHYLVAGGAQPQVMLPAPLVQDQSAGISQLSFACWLQVPEGMDSASVILSFGKNHYYELGITDQGKASLITQGHQVIDPNEVDSQFLNTLESGLAINDGQWHHICAIYDGVGGFKRLYIDGHLDREIADPHEGALGSGTTRYGIIGAPSYSESFADNPLPADAHLLSREADDIVRIGPLYLYNSALDNVSIEQLVNQDNSYLLNRLTKTYNLDNGYYTQVRMVQHENQLVLLAQASDGRYYYGAVAPQIVSNSERNQRAAEQLRSGTQDNSQVRTDVSYWPAALKQLLFPTELSQVGYSIVDNYVFEDQPEDPREDNYSMTVFNRSTGILGENQPFRLLSDGEYLILCRQAKSKDDASVPRRNNKAIVDKTLLLDRFVLTGDTLTPKLESRYQRSRNKIRPFNSKDSKDVRDLNGEFFYEPTHELAFVDDLYNGQFDVTLVPTSTGSQSRWSIMALEHKRKLLRYFSLPTANDGLFDTKGKTYYTSPDVQYRDSIYQDRPGLDPFSGEPLIPVQGKPGSAGYALSLISGSYLRLDNPWYEAANTGASNGKPQQFTLLLRLKSQLVQSGDGPRWLLSSDSHTGLSVWIANNNILYFEYGGIQRSVPAVIPDENWHQLTFVYRQGEIIIYRDGVSQALTSSSESKPAQPFASIDSGLYQLGGGSQDLGQVDDIQLWSLALENEILFDAVNIVPQPNAPGLVAYYGINEGAGGEVYDHSSKKRIASLTPGSANGQSLTTNDLWRRSTANQFESTGLVQRLYKLHDTPAAADINDYLGFDLEYYQVQEDGMNGDGEPTNVLSDRRMMLTAAVGQSNSTKLAAVDFAVDLDGTLANVGTRLALPALDTGGQGLPLERLAELETQVEALKAKYDAAVGWLRQNNFLLTLDEGNTPLAFGRDAALELNFNYLVNLDYDFSDNNNLDLSALIRDNETFNAAYEQVFLVDPDDGSGNRLAPSLDGSLMPLDADLSGLYPNFSADAMGKLLFNNEDVNQQQNYQTFLLQLSEFRWARETTRLAAQYNGGQQQILWPSGVFQYVNAAASHGAGLNVDPHLLVTGIMLNLYFDYAVKLQQLTDARENYNSESQFMMPIVAADQRGLTAKAGFFNEIRPQTAPTLKRNSSGGVEVFFKGRNNKMLSAYYGTATGRAIHSLATSNQEKTYIQAKSTETEYNHTRISISDGSTAQLCNLNIVNSALGLTETWSDVPRSPGKFATVINGKASTLTGLALDLQTYDYTNVITEADTNGLELGSRLIYVVPASSISPANNLLENVSNALPDAVFKANSWTTDKVDKGLNFNGSNHLQATADEQSRVLINALQDMTLEAWYLPQLTASPQTLMAYRDPQNRQADIRLKLVPQSDPLKYKINFQHAGKQFQSRTSYAFNSLAHYAVVMKKQGGLELAPRARKLTVNDTSGTFALKGDTTLDLTFSLANTRKDVDQVLMQKGNNFKVFVDTTGNLALTFRDEDAHEFTTKLPTGTVLQNNTRYRIFVSIDQAVNTRAALNDIYASSTNVGSATDLTSLIPDGTSFRLNNSDNYTIDNFAVPSLPDTSTDTSSGANSQYIVAVNLEVYNLDAGDDVPSLALDSPDKHYCGNFLDQQDNSAFELMTNLGSSRTIYQAAFWSLLRAKADQNTLISGSEEGLTAWWPFSENAGGVAANRQNDQLSLDFSGARGTPAAGFNWQLGSADQGINLYVNGRESELDSVAVDHIPAGDAIIGLQLGCDASQNNHCTGHLGDLRLWRSVRSYEQLIEAAFSATPGSSQDLLLHYDLNRSDDNQVFNQAANGFALNIIEPSNAENTDLVVSQSVAPVGYNAPFIRNVFLDANSPMHIEVKTDSPLDVAYYAVANQGSTGVEGGLYKGAYAYVDNGELKIYTGQPVAELYTEWLSQVQTDPQIVGFIEGAPPVPGENLTGGDYKGATSVAVSTSESDSYSWGRSRSDSGSVGINFDFGIGPTVDASNNFSPLGFGPSLKVIKAKSRFNLGFNASFGGGFDASKSLSANLSLSQELQQSLGGEQERKQNYYLTPQRRFQPDNLGTALVESLTADLFALRIKRNKALVGYSVVPNEDIPRDRNIIHFPINPKYTKQGTLDGKLGFSSQDSQFVLIKDPNYPQAATYGEYSYFKPKETYRLIQEIDDNQAQIQEKYNQWDTWKLRTFDYNLGGLPSQNSDAIVGSSDQGEQNRQQYEPPKLAFAVDLYNRYIWTAEGGMYKETSGYTEEVKNSYTGKFNFKFSAKAGFKTDIVLTAVAFDIGLGLSVDASLNLSTTKSKGSKDGFSLSASVSGEKDLQLYTINEAERSFYGATEVGDAAYDLDNAISTPHGEYTPGTAINRPGKVDAYRFYSFFLQPKEASFDYLREMVIDQAWIRESNDPGAAALRQVLKPGVPLRENEKSKPWRIMHRVSYVSRILPPASGTSGETTTEQKVGSKFGSNHQLLRLLEPYVYADDLTSGQLDARVRNAVNLYLPEFSDHQSKQYIVNLFKDYYGLA
ncbi:laminin G domain-containing protein [Thalassomonas viridans]|uniref:Laminin G domain-containing protein n=1 Tax=Thalassomonas viridans TaxID=137584 RepID=A0AAE9YXX2_9GAMM|nr:LamG-like jellyroll fold domain-containing protein [Thalassomonas viridans]WDE02958.1 laminin G domain-containing protein [Thalassomonas viridans]